MSKYKAYLSVIMLILSMILLIVSLVFAWMAFVGKKPLASFHTAELSFIAKVNKSDQTELVQINSLVYVDFYNDVVLNRSGSLNKLASVISVQIINGENSLPIKTTFQIVEELNKMGLLMMVVYEGKNLNENQIGSTFDYYNRFKNIIGLETNPDTQRDLITSYNESTINSIKQVQLNVGEWLSFKVALWGDYEKVVNKESYLAETYTLKISMTANQANRGDE